MARIRTNVRPAVDELASNLDKQTVNQTELEIEDMETLEQIRDEFGDKIEDQIELDITE